MSARLAPTWYRSGFVVKAGGVAALLLVIYAVFTQTRPTTSWSSNPAWPKEPWHKAPQSVDLLDHIANQTLGFQRIFAIIMPARVDQRDALSLAGAVTGIDVSLVDGVSSLDAKTLPPGGDGMDTQMGWIKAWRAHLDVLRLIVRENITSALIMEGDVDWDLRVKTQLRDFARASRLLTQPRSGTTDDFIDPTYPKSYTGQTHTDFNVSEDLTAKPKISPYGDHWDVLWIGHCGVRFPHSDDEQTSLPLARVVIPNDESVPAKDDIDMQYGTDELKDEYPQHTRVVSRARENVCSLAYAVTQQSARQILYELGIRRIDAAFDLMLRGYCDGLDGRRMRVCMSLQPTYFQQHRRAGSNKALSDIGGDAAEGNNEVAYTRNIRWSVQTNLETILNGEADYIDWHR